jgi:hypothetical protein
MFVSVAGKMLRAATLIVSAEINAEQELVRQSLCSEIMKLCGLSFCFLLSDVALQQQQQHRRTEILGTATEAPLGETKGQIQQRRARAESL